jgi:hypothetical protein
VGFSFCVSTALVILSVSGAYLGVACCYDTTTMVIAPKHTLVHRIRQDRQDHGLSSTQSTYIQNFQCTKMDPRRTHTHTFRLEPAIDKKILIQLNDQSALQRFELSDEHTTQLIAACPQLQRTSSFPPANSTAKVPRTLRQRLTALFWRSTSASSISAHSHDASGAGPQPQKSSAGAKHDDSERNAIAENMARSISAESRASAGRKHKNNSFSNAASGEFRTIGRTVSAASYASFLKDSHQRELFRSGSAGSKGTADRDAKPNAHSSNTLSMSHRHKTASEQCVRTAHETHAAKAKSTAGTMQSIAARLATSRAFGGFVILGVLASCLSLASDTPRCRAERSCLFSESDLQIFDTAVGAVVFVVVVFLCVCVCVCAILFTVVLFSCISERERERERGAIVFAMASSLCGCVREFAMTCLCTLCVFACELDTPKEKSLFD